MPEARTPDGITINYSDRGASDDVVLFVPGLGMSEATWAAHAEAAAASGRRALAMDPRGSGASATPDAPYTPELIAADVLAVLDAAGVQRAHLVGQSMGGMMAQDVALRHPERVRSLALVSTFAATDEWSGNIMAMRRRLIETGGLDLQFAVSLYFVFSPASYRSLRPFIAGLEERLATSPPDRAAYLRQIDYIAAHDATAGLGSVTLPTLVVAGGADVLTSALQGRELAALVPGARYEEFAEASHGLIWEEPERFGALLAAFLERVG